MSKSDLLCQEYVELRKKLFKAEAEFEVVETEYDICCKKRKDAKTTYDGAIKKLGFIAKDKAILEAKSLIVSDELIRVYEQAKIDVADAWFVYRGSVKEFGKCKIKKAMKKIELDSVNAEIEKFICSNKDE